MNCRNSSNGNINNGVTIINCVCVSLSCVANYKSVNLLSNWTQTEWTKTARRCHVERKKNKWIEFWLMWFSGKQISISFCGLCISFPPLSLTLCISVQQKCINMRFSDDKTDMNWMKCTHQHHRHQTDVKKWGRQRAKRARVSKSWVSYSCEN